MQVKRQGEHSAILSTFIKLTFYTGFTALYTYSHAYLSVVALKSGIYCVEEVVRELISCKRIYDQEQRSR